MPEQVRRHVRYYSNSTSNLCVKSSKYVTQPVTSGLVNGAFIFTNFGHQIFKAAIHHLMNFLSELELGIIRISNETFDNI